MKPKVELTVKKNENTSETDLDHLRKNETLKATRDAQEKLKKSVPELTDPDTAQKDEIIKSLEIPNVKKEEDLQRIIDQNPAYKEANLTPSQLISFLHTQNQISENPTLKNQLSQNSDFIAFDKNFLKFQDDLNLYKPLKSKNIPVEPPSPVEVKNLNNLNNDSITALAENNPSLKAYSGTPKRPDTYRNLSTEGIDLQNFVFKKTLQKK